MSSNAYLDQKLSPEQRADVLLKDMTLNEKMAQVNCVFPYGGVEYDFDWIADHTRGGIGEVSTLEVRTMKTLREAAAPGTERPVAIQPFSSDFPKQESLLRRQLYCLQPPRNQTVHIWLWTRRLKI